MLGIVAGFAPPPLTPHPARQHRDAEHADAEHQGGEQRTVDDVAQLQPHWLAIASAMP